MDEVSPKNRIRLRSTTATFWLAMLISILLHALLLIWASKGPKSFKQKVDSSPKPLAAHLVFTSPPKPALPGPPAKPIAPLQPMVEAPGVNEKTATTESQLTQVTETAPPPPAINMDQVPRVSSAELAKQHVQAIAQNQQEQLAKQAAWEYRQQKNSPALPSRQIDPFISQDENLLKQIGITADCSSTGKKVSVHLLSILGGHIECSQPPALDQFIQLRLNKGVEKKPNR